MEVGLGIIANDGNGDDVDDSLIENVTDDMRKLAEIGVLAYWLIGNSKDRGLS